MMKILFIHNYYKKAGGEDQVVENEMALLREQGHQVALLSFHNEALKQGIGEIRNFFFNTTAYQSVIQSIRKFQPDVIHVHNFFYQASPAVFYAAQSAAVPVVQTLHNYRLICANALLMRDAKPCELCIKQVFNWYGVKYKCFQGSAIKTALLSSMIAWHHEQKTWVSRVNRFIALTDFAKQKFISSALGIPAHKITVKANSVIDLGVLPPAKRENFLLFVGRLSTEKGIEVLLDALVLIQLPVRIIGNGPLAQRVVERVQQLDHVQYLGEQSHHEVLAQLGKSRGVLFPSVCYEGLPTVILEAFSVGTPVIASAIDNINQIVLNQVNGLTFETGNAQALAKQANLLVEEQRWAKLAEKARWSFEQAYTPEMNYQQLIEIYQEVIQS
ncbi:MAG: glycosyltransferase family 4 protein [Flammeovirgaceae bacterium]